MSLFLLMAFSSAAGADTSILFSASGTFEKRAAISKLLANDSMKPLPLQSSIAELCYDIDICAQAESAVTTNLDCSNYSKEIPERQSFSDNCAVKKAKEIYGCSKDSASMDLSSLLKMNTVIGDLNTAISSQYLDLLVANLETESGIKMTARKM